MRRSRATARILVTLALSGLAGVLAWWAADAFWVYQAKRGAHSVVLSHRAMQLYVMRPALYASKAKGAIAEELNAAEILSSSDIVREQQRVYSEARRQLGMAPVFYRMAADNPLNPANQVDEREERLISFFNTHMVAERRSTCGSLLRRHLRRHSGRTTTAPGRGVNASSSSTTRRLCAW